MKVVAFKAPKQLAETIRARMRAPMGPKTRAPKVTAMVFEEAMVLAGRTRMYERVARR